MFNAISSFILRLLGWKLIQEEDLRKVKKFITVVVPHTSNWDFPLGLLVRSAMKIDIRYLAKSSLFRPPFGMLFRWLGGYPVDRSKRHNYVESVAALFGEKETFHICIAPEGTRQRVDKLKSGFYFMAKAAGVPLVLCRFDWGKKEVVFGKAWLPTDDQEADFRRIDDFFRGAAGKNPELGYLYGN